MTSYDEVHVPLFWQGFATSQKLGRFVVVVVVVVVGIGVVVVVVVVGVVVGIGVVVVVGVVVGKGVVVVAAVVVKISVQNSPTHPAEHTHRCLLWPVIESGASTQVMALF